MAPELESSDSLLMELSVWLSRKEKVGARVENVVIDKGIFNSTLVTRVDEEPIVLYRQGLFGKRKLLFGEKIAEQLREDGFVLEKEGDVVRMVASADPD